MFPGDKIKGREQRNVPGQAEQDQKCVFTLT